MRGHRLSTEEPPDATSSGDGGGERSLTEPSRAWAELARIPLSDLTLTQVMQRVAELARATIPGADDVSVTLIKDGRPASVAFTGDLAVHLDERQYERGFGPCTDAATAGTLISIADVGDDDRYPDYNRAAARAGVRSSLSVGMPVPQRTVGGMNLYSRTAGVFDDAAVEAAQVFVDYAAVALINADLLDSSTRLARQMEQAMVNRATIEQAKGILIAHFRVSPDEAFTHLARQSQHANRKLHDIAAEIVRNAGRGQAPAR
ncbi:GAF domain-containing protein [Quadrisphaera sp. DSM 44207]|nr:GAF domain-containing protein [Quadrisphaera sp. DSM 44207]